VKPFCIYVSTIRGAETEHLDHTDLLWASDLTADKGDPDGIYVWVRFADHSSTTCHVVIFLHVLYLLLHSVFKIPPSSSLPYDHSRRHVGLIFVSSRRPSFKLCLCSRSRTARGLPVSPMWLLPHSQRMLQAHCVPCCRFLSCLDFKNELLREWLVLEIFLMLRYTFELLRNTLQRWDIHRAQRLFLRIGKTATVGINNRVN
jgi:hypothetical protein